MKTYSITYDLTKPGQNYQLLWDRLRALGASKVEESHWILKTNASAMDVATDLLRCMDNTDRLLVAGLTGEAAWRSLMVSDDRAEKILAA